MHTYTLVPKSIYHKKCKQALLRTPQGDVTEVRKQTEEGDGLKGTQQKHGWGKDIQLPFATGGIFSKHKSNSRIKPQHTVAVWAALPGIWPLPACLASAPHLPYSCTPRPPHSLISPHSLLPQGFAHAVSSIWNTFLSSILLVYL